MTPETLIAYGEALYGPHWQTELARVLKVNERTMRRWKAGTSKIPESAAVEIAALAIARASQLVALPPP